MHVERWIRDLLLWKLPDETLRVVRVFRRRHWCRRREVVQMRLDSATSRGASARVRRRGRYKFCAQKWGVAGRTRGRGGEQGGILNGYRWCVDLCGHRRGGESRRNERLGRDGARFRKLARTGTVHHFEACTGEVVRSKIARAAFQTVRGPLQGGQVASFKRIKDFSKARRGIL